MRSLDDWIMMSVGKVQCGIDDDDDGDSKIRVMVRKRGEDDDDDDDDNDVDSLGRERNDIKCCLVKENQP